MTASFRNDLEQMLKRQVTLGIESIFSSVYSGSSLETLSFTHILNRVMMLVQLPLTFVILESDESGGYSICFKTNRHKRKDHKDAITAATDSSDPENYFELWHSKKSSENNKFYLLVLKADKSYKFEQLLKIREIKDSMNSWDIGSYKLTQVFDRSNYRQYGDFPDKIISIIGNTKANIDKDEKADPNDHFSSAPNYFQDDAARISIKSEFDRNLLSNMGPMFYEKLKKRGVLDKVFKKIERNISDVNSGKEGRDGSITNFLLFARDYHNTPLGPWRHSSYDYSLRILLCDSQKEEIKEFFKTLRQKKEFYRKRYADEISNIKGDIKLIAAEIDTRFWSILESGDSGSTELIDILGEYFSANARSMADPVFDGLSFYRQPFANDGGIARCFQPESVLPSSIGEIPPGSDTIKDLLRVVCCQYLFDFMAAPGDKNNETKLQLQIMLNPIEIGGRVWGVVAYATRSHNPNFEFKNKVDLNWYESYWVKNYHIYRDVNERMKKNLRSYMNAFYENFVARTFVAMMNAIAYQRSGYLADRQRELNHQLGLLACIFPYDMLEVRFKREYGEETPVPSSDKPEWESRAMAGRGWAAFVSVARQVRFPIAPGVSPGSTVGFVDTTDVAVAMTDMLLREAVVSPDQQKENGK